MATLNKVMLIGRTGKDPEVRYTISGTAVASVSIATDESYKDKLGQKVEKTGWHNLVFWGRLAEIVGEYVGKGKEIFVEGKLQTRKWQDKDGNDRYSTEIICEKMQMLGSKGDGSRREASGDNYNGVDGGYDTSFNPDDIPF